MNIYVLFSLLLFLAPGGCPIYSIDLSTLEVPTDFQNELTLQSMLSTELNQYRNKLNSNSNAEEVSSMQHFQQARDLDEDRDHHLDEDPFERAELLRSIEDRIKGTYYAAASPEETKQGQRYAENKIPRETKSDVCSNEATFFGTNLFGSHPKRCFSTEDIALMSARKDFEMLLPKTYPQTLVNDDIVYMLMKFFNSVNQVVKRMSDTETRRLVHRAFYDALGGYLRYYLVPVAQVSYYAGRLKLCTVQRVVALYRQCQLVLNTNGNGWKLPETDILAQLKNVRIKPIQLNESSSVQSDASSCALLDTNCADNDSDGDDQMIVPLPHLEMEDSYGLLTNIILPFKNRRVFNLRSPDSAFILVKFYKTLSNCYRYRGACQKVYNQKLRLWIKESVQMHYRDEMFYPGLGGILQIYEALSTPGIKKESHMSEDDEQPEQEPVLNEEESKDYDFAPDDINLDQKKEQGKKGKSKATKSESSNKKAKVKGKDFERERDSSRGGKQSRSPKPNTIDERTIFFEDRNQTQEEATTEVCTDCDSDNYVGYAAVILGVILVSLVIIVCLCIYCKKKDKKPVKQTKPPEPPKPLVGGANTKTSEKSVSVPVPELKPTKEDERSCWKTLFRSRKLERQSQFRQFEKMPLKHGFKQSHGSIDPRSSAGFIDLEGQGQRKKQDHKYDELSDHTFTSTSSLGYQFKKKFIPIRMGREKREEYYRNAEKKRSKAVSKPSTSQGTTHVRVKDPKQKLSKTEEERLVGRQRVKEGYAKDKVGPEEEPTRKKCKVKHKRQEGGGSHSQEGERLRGSERTERTRPSDSITSHSSEYRIIKSSHDRKLEGKGKRSETGRENETSSSVIICIEKKPVTQAHKGGCSKVQDTQRKHATSGENRNDELQICIENETQTVNQKNAKTARIFPSTSTEVCAKSNSSWKTIYTDESK